MSIKSFIQILLLILISSIIGGIYYKYFNTNKKIVEEANISELKNEEILKKLDKKISDLELKNLELNKKLIENKKKAVELSPKNVVEKVIKTNQLELENIKTEKEKIQKIEKENILEEKVVKNLVKDVEYISVDQKGNKFFLLASSGKSNKDNNDILDLINVRGKITSDKRDTIFIVSDFAQYNTINLNSKFYENVIINYQDKKITSLNFDINMNTNKAQAYNDVEITDPKSIMRAGIVEFDLETKDIIINPESANANVKVITN